MPSLAIASGDYFPSNVTKPESNFRVGFMVEAVHPLYPDHVAPARVVAIQPEENTFTVGIDDWTKYSTEPCINSHILQEPPYSISFVSHAGDGRILPPGLAALRGIPLLPPPGLEAVASMYGLLLNRDNQQFNWLQYFSLCKVHLSKVRQTYTCEREVEENIPYIPSTKYFEWNAYRASVAKASSSYSVGNLVEAVLPNTISRKNVVYRPAVVTRILGPLIWVSFEGSQNAAMFDVSSTYLRTRSPEASLPTSQIHSSQSFVPTSPITRSRSHMRQKLDDCPSTPTKTLIKIRIHADRCFRGHKIADVHLRQLPRVLGPGKPEDILHKLVYFMSRCFSVKRGIFIPLSQWNPHTYPDGANNSIRRPIYWFSKGLPCRVRVHSIAFPTTLLGAMEFCKRLCLLLSLCPGYISACQSFDDKEVILQERSFTEICTFVCATRHLPGVYPDERRFTLKMKGSLAFPLQIRGHVYDHPLDLVDASSSSSSSEEVSSDNQRNDKKASVQLNRIVTRGKKFVVPPSLMHTHRPAAARKRLSLPPPPPSNNSETESFVSNTVSKRSRLDNDSIVSEESFGHPKTWTTDDLVKFLSQHSTPLPVCDWARREKLDGSAFMLLDYPMMYCLGLNTHIVKHLGDLIIKLRKAVIIM